jgi:hypothetical protein
MHGIHRNYPIESEPPLLTEYVLLIMAHHLAVFRKEFFQAPIFLNSYEHFLAIPDS